MIGDSFRRKRGPQRRMVEDIMYSLLAPRRPFMFSLEKRGFTLRGF